jgi:hypothetical protein
LPSTPAPDTALNVYRRALAAQPDGSVVMVEIGYNENLSNLLHSGPDAISPLNGHDLIAQKVKELVVMGGGYPSRSIENNLAGNPGAAQDVAANWPTKIVWSGYEVGDQIHTGQTISGTHPANSPVRVAYEAFVGPNNWIYSYDLTAVYHAIRPADTTMTEVGPGTNAIDSSGGNVFTMGAGDQYYLKLGSATALDASIEQLLDVVPTQTTTTTSTSTTSTTSTSTTTTSTTATSTTTSSTTTSTTTAPPGPSDNFDSNSLNPAVWSTSSTGSTVAAANQELEITHPGGAWTTGTLTSNPFDITSHAVQVQVKRPAGGDVSTACGSGMTCYGETSVFLWLDSSHYAELFFAGNALTAWINNGAGEVNLTPSWPHYDPTAMQWVRLRESGGMLLFEYAGGTTSPGPWTTLASTNDPFPLTSVRFMLKAGANLDSTDTAQFDNVSTS